MTNSAGPDQTPRSALSNFDLQCLPDYFFVYDISYKWVKMTKYLFSTPAALTPQKMARSLKQKLFRSWYVLADDLLKYFPYFPQKQVLTFHVNCLKWRKLAWNVKYWFLGKNIINMSSALAQRVVKVKTNSTYLFLLRFVSNCFKYMGWDLSNFQCDIN